MGQFSFFLEYCIEIIPKDGNWGSAIRILRNSEIVNTIPKRFTEVQKICFADFDIKNDLIELRHTGNDGVSISVNLIAEEKTQKLKFGAKKDLDVIRIDGPAQSSMGWFCGPKVESTGSLQIQNGKIIQSACVQRGKLLKKQLIIKRT